MASKILNVNMEFPWWFSLAGAIWIFYSGDHLIDAFKLKNPKSRRRKFYSEHFSPLLYVTIFLLMVNIFSSFFFLDNKIIMFGISVGLVTSLYLSLVFLFGKKKKYWLQKELSVAVIYTAGIWGSLIIESGHAPGLVIMLIIFSFFLLVLSDILIFALIEYQQDHQDEFISIIGMIGKKNVSTLIHILLIITILTSIFIIFINPENKYITAALIFIFMDLVLFLIFYFKKRLLKNDWYR
ncbi:MAG: hypothetical protein P1P88_20065, partial [Bacteroidales bacterium]|nr:hypothetical protein [Bacteroidales bacterium]